MQRAKNSTRKISNFRVADLFTIDFFRSLFDSCASIAGMEVAKKRRKRGELERDDPDTLIKQVQSRIPPGHPREETSFELLYPDWRLENPVQVFAERVGSALPFPELPRVEAKVQRLQELDPAEPTVYNEKITRNFAEKRARLNESGEYFKYEELSEEALRQTVEYDLDEQDLCWIELYNASCNKSVGRIEHNFFELAMDLLEKEWFELVKKLPRHMEEHVHPEDSVCSICGDGECENVNAIVFCDGCNLAVHQDCYGIPYIPEGQWLCRRCMITPQNTPVNCLFCPHTDGAFKQTINNQWAHLLCAMWIPETGVANPVYMEPIDGVEKVPKTRWKLVCYICRQRTGACIQCSNKLCYLAFHATCARKAGLCLKMKHGEDHEMHCTQRFCDKHTPPSFDTVENVHNRILWCRKQCANQQGNFFNGAVPPRPRAALSSVGAPGVAKKKRRGRPPRVRVNVLQPTDASVQSKVESSAALPKPEILEAFDSRRPVAPRYLLRLIGALPSFQSSGVAEKHKKLASIAQYWALKREAKCGAPLLKRLHLEPWTTSTSEVQHSEKEQQEKLHLMQTLWSNLDSARTLIDECRRRERLKLRALRVLAEWVERLIAPACYLVRPVFLQMQAMDKKQFFAQLIDVRDVPDYYDIIKKPISFQQISERIASYSYQTIADFANDVRLLVSNCIVYNKKETPYYRAAIKVRDYLDKVLPELEAAFSVRKQLCKRTACKGAIEHLFEYHYSSSQLSEILDIGPKPMNTRSQSQRNAKG